MAAKHVLGQVRGGARRGTCAGGGVAAVISWGGLLVGQAEDAGTLRNGETEGKGGRQEPRGSWNLLAAGILQLGLFASATHLGAAVTAGHLLLPAAAFCSCRRSTTSCSGCSSRAAGCSTTQVGYRTVWETGDLLQLATSGPPFHYASWATVGSSQVTCCHALAAEHHRSTLPLHGWATAMRFHHDGSVRHLHCTCRGKVPEGGGACRST